MIRVFIVDDDKLARMGLETMLPWEKHGMCVVGEAANGAKALDALTITEADLIFVDLSMPVMTGLEFIKAAKGKYPELLYVVLTFHEDFALVQQAMRLGVLDYISKLELEDADYDMLCLRLRQKVEAQKPQHVQCRSVGPLPDWTKCLQSMRWIYDHMYLEELITQINENPISQIATEHAIVRGIAYVESYIGLTTPVLQLREPIGNVSVFLRHYRETCIQKALNDIGNTRLAVSILRVIDYIHKNLSGNLQIDHMANIAGLSRPYFSSSFAKEVQIPCHAYMQGERIAEAKRLLLTTDLNIGEIASRVGYEDIRSLTKLFIKHEKITPSAFRSKNKNRRS